MAYLDKLLGIVAMGSSVANVSLLQRFLSGITVVITLTTVCGTMLGVMTSFGFYGLYLLLISYGLDRQAAVISVGLLAFAAAATLGSIAYLRWRQLREMSRLVHLEKPIFEHAGRVLDAFIDGFLDRAPQPAQDNVHKFRRDSRR